jgi:hypothetical protein
MIGADPQTRQAYVARHIKRYRSTRAEVEGRRAALYEIVEAMRPMTVRQVFYQATISGLVDKTEAGYAKAQTDLVRMRREGWLPYGWLADNTRWQRKPRTFSSIEQALQDTAHFYRKSLWDDAQAYVEVWLEKDALAGVVNSVTDLYDVPLMVSRGYASLSFLHTAASYMNGLDVPSYVYHFGDFDPSGVNAADKIEQTLIELAPDADINFERVAITEAQIVALKLPSRPTKASDTRSRNFGDVSVELDAMQPGLLRALVESVINRHLPQDQLKVLQEAERSEREVLSMFAGTFGGVQ